MCTSVESFWEVGLQLKNDGNANEWEISSVTMLAYNMAPEYAGGYSFIPSSSLKDNIFFADWDSGKVKMMEFGTDGLPLGTVDAPQISDFIVLEEGQSPSYFRPWGFFFDPIVSDCKGCCSFDPATSLLCILTNHHVFAHLHSPTSSDKRLLRVHLG